MRFPQANEAGFSLLELMVVVAILVLIAALTIPALTALSGSHGLSTGGRIVSNLLTVARSEAINRRASVRFEVATSWPADPTQVYRKIALVQHDSVSNTDTQITGWQTLPNGVLGKTVHLRQTLANISSTLVPTNLRNCLSEVRPLIVVT
jgi:prepilin-type N-terminal cleavage/methylation domain-containing protein